MKRFILWLFLTVVLLAGAVTGIIFLGWIGVIVVLIGLFFLFCRFTKVEEGTAKAVMSFGGFRKIIFQWKDHWMDEEGNILKKDEEGEGKRKKVGGHIFGGLWWYGFWPIHKIYRYKLRWTDIHLTEEGKMELHFHKDEEFDRVLLKPNVYAIKLFAVETAPPERIPVDVIVLVTMREVNPYRFLFIAPPTPLEDVLVRITALMREVVTSYNVDDLLQLTGKSLWTEGGGSVLEGTKLIEDTLEKWGLKLADKGIEIKDIDFQPDYQKAAAAKRTAEMKAAGRAEEIMGTVIISVARAEGKPESEIQKEFQQNPKEFYGKHKTIIDNTMTKLSMEERAYLRIETPGATPFGGEFLRFIGAWLRMPMGGEEKEDKKPSESEKEETEEEKGKKFFEKLAKESKEHLAKKSKGR